MEAPPVTPVAVPDAAPEVSIVLPCLDEEGTVGSCVRSALESLAREGIAGEVVVCDNGSRDRSAERAREAGARVVYCPVRGYGAALQVGLAAARGRYLVTADADGSYDFGDCPRLVRALRDGHPLVLGTRLGGSIVPGSMPLLNRYLGTPVLSWVLNRLFDCRTTDCNSGMRGLERQTLAALELVSPGMELASEMLVKARVRGIPIHEVGITFRPDGRQGPSHLRRWRDGWRHLRLLVWHAPDHALTLPGLALLLAGLALTLAQLPGPFRLAGLVFDIHYMILGATLAMIGASAASVGLTVRALMAGRALRARPVEALASWSRPVWTVLVLALLAAGLAADGYVLWYWLSTGRGALSAFHTRLALLALVLLALGLQALILGVVARAARDARLEEALRAEQARVRESAPC